MRHHEPTAASPTDTTASGEPHAASRAPHSSVLRWWQHITVPFDVLIASVVVAAMLVLSVVLAYQAGNSARQAMITASDENAQLISELISERVHRIVNPADATIRLLAFDPVTVAPDLPARMRRLPVLFRLLEQNQLLSAVYIGYPDGQFLLLRALHNAAVREEVKAPANAAFLLQSIAHEQGGGALTGRFSYYDAQHQLISSAERPDYQYDPRVRPWYASALEKKSQVLTEPYIFFTTHEIGVTLSQPGEYGGAVVGMDVALTDLSAEIGRLHLLPRTEIAVVDPDWRVLAYTDMSRVLQRDGDTPSLKLRHLDDLGVASLQAMQALDLQNGSSQRFKAQGEEWVANGFALQSPRWQGLRLLMAIPTRELLADVDKRLRQQLWWSLATIALLLPLGWCAGRRVASSLTGLALQAQALARFDFRRTPVPRSAVREVRALGEVMDRMSTTIQEFLDITHHISAESRTDRMLSSVLYELVGATSCTGGAVYLVEAGAGHLQRVACYKKGSTGDSDLPECFPQRVPLEHFTNHTQPQAEDQAIGGAEPPHALRVQLRTRDGQPLGLLVLHYLADIRHDDVHFRAFAEKLSGTLSVAIETSNLIEGQLELLDAIIRLLADAIDAKSPYTGAHCERVPQLAETLMQRMCDAKDGPFAAVGMTDAERYEFRLGAWLHDCGKVTVPEHIIDKATKLETIYNRIHEVRMRFEVLWRDAELHYCKQLLSDTQPADAAQQEQWQRLERQLQQRHAQLQQDFAFVARCNVGGEAMADADVQRLAEIGQQTWLRHFDDRLGLSRAEVQRVASLPVKDLPAREPLLADRLEHLVPWGARRPPVEAGNPENRWGFDMQLPAQQAHLGELHNLSVRRGTLTTEDRFRINDHIVQTIVMLKGLAFPPHLARVPDIAGSHHEKLDGTGYPRRLGTEQLTLADRVMTLADIFEALTASDRPYKPAKSLSESLNIMARMVREQHIDGQVFRFFLESGVYREYAAQFLSEAQRDAVDVPALLASLD